MKIARIYTRVSTQQQDTDRQLALVDEARAQGYYVAKIYTEKASGATADRPKLNELIEDLQPGDVIIAENIDRISRLPLADAERLIQRIQEKGAGMAIPGILDLTEYDLDGQPEIAKIMMTGFRDIMLKIALQIARDDYEVRRTRQAQGIARAKADNKYRGRPPNHELYRSIHKLRQRGLTIKDIAGLANTSVATVKRVLKQYPDVEDIPAAGRR